MTNKQTIMIMFLILAGCVAYSGYVYSILPPVVPSHWNIQGQVDAYAGKGTILAILVAPLCIPVILTLILPWLPTKGGDREAFEKIFRYLTVVLTAFMAFVDVAILYMIQHPQYSFTRAIMIGAFVLLGLLGNVLGKIPRNQWAGIRTQWTLASDTVWRSTHRMTGPLWVVGSLIAVIWLALGGSILMPIVVLIPMVLVPILYSYLLFKEEAGRG
jgi:uncharacterized membrane protein